MAERVRNSVKARWCTSFLKPSREKVAVVLGDRSHLQIGVAVVNLHDDLAEDAAAHVGHGAIDRA